MQQVPCLLKFSCDRYVQTLGKRPVRKSLYTMSAWFEAFPKCWGLSWANPVALSQAYLYRRIWALAGWFWLGHYWGELTDTQASSPIGSQEHNIGAVNSWMSFDLGSAYLTTVILGRSLCRLSHRFLAGQIRVMHLPCRTVVRLRAKYLNCSFY